MSVVLILNRLPITYPLSGPFAGCTVTLRRLTSPEFAMARAAALALMSNTTELFTLLEDFNARPEGRKFGDLVKDRDFMAGVGQWVGAVECGVRGISAWTGFMDGEGPEAQPVPVTRQSLQAAFFNEAFVDQVLPLIDRAANLTASEGNVSGASPIGSPVQDRTASAPNTVPAAQKAESPAPKAIRVRGQASSVRSSSSRPKP